jgi:lipopolysaccharide/colanic/teichoic acid biosynthesis glycosyltransferase
MSSRTLRSAILLCDLVWLVAALLIADHIRFRAAWSLSGLDGKLIEYQPILLLSITVWIVLYYWMRLDGFRGGWNFPSVFSQVVSGVFVLLALVLAGAYMGKELFSRIAIFHYSYLVVIGLVAIRYLAKRIFQSSYISRARRRVVILGESRVAQELANKISRHPELMTEVVGFLCRPGAEIESWDARKSAGRRSMGPLSAVEFLAQEGIQELYVVMSESSDPETLGLISECRARGVAVSLIPHLYELYTSRPEFLELDGLPVISLRRYSSSPGMLAVKRGMDLLLAGPLLVLSLPLWAVAAAVLRKREHLLARAPRAGHDGKRFDMLRFNLSRDTTSRSFGERVLVTFSLTELPQLWNVVRGDMSVVGPRPESLERVRHYSEWERLRLSIRPGMTGLAQVYGLREQSSSNDKARFDLQYIIQWTPLLDLSLVLQTVWTLLNRKMIAAQVQRQGLPVPLPAKPVEFFASPFQTELVDADRSQSGTD